MAWIKGMEGIFDTDGQDFGLGRGVWIPACAGMTVEGWE